MVPDYEKFIADAARELVKATTEDELTRREGTAAARKFAYGKLWWMTEAEKHGWDPHEFEPSCLD